MKLKQLIESHDEAVKGPIWLTQYPSSSLTDKWPTPIARLNGDFSVIFGKLVDLRGGPLEVDGDYSVNNNRIVTLVGSPTYVNGDVDLYSNKIQSLNGLMIKCTGRLDLSDNKLSSLKDIHKHILYAKSLFIDDNPVTSHVLGIFKIKGLEKLSVAFGHDPATDQELKASRIVNQTFVKFGATSEGLFECQEALLDAGLDSYAQV